ncbi:MAG: DUF2867 domain-containing protein [Spirochaetales bacterium]|nr:MAG: DUF2867 domain-containing protein [Spirochaetales bacterium]
MAHNDAGPVLVTGASGYIGGRLLRALLADGHQVRCMVRNPGNIRGKVPAEVEVVQGDVFDPPSLERALHGVQVAYYNIHSLGAQSDFEQADRVAATNFAAAARRNGASRIIYLGGLGAEPGLSRHLASRQEVGRLLGGAGVPCVELRASIVIGSGSLSFEMVRALVEKLPVMTTPRWVRALAQPIAVEDVIQYLTESLTIPVTGHDIYEIGGADTVSYDGIMRAYAKARNLKRLIIPVPLLTPGLSSRWLALVTPLYARVGRWLIDGVKNETVVTNDRAVAVFSVRPMGITQAITRALANEDAETAQTRWSDSLGPHYTSAHWGGDRRGSRFVYSVSTELPVPKEETFLPIQYIGGHTGWYSHSWMWTIRGMIDKAGGGVGRNRGRRDPLILLPGDAVDFWRVEDVEQYRMLRLRSEMKLPGRGWLQFETDDLQLEDGGLGTTLSIHAIFEPLGLRGLIYWYALYPAHLLIFGRMLKEITRAAHH